MPGAAFFDFRFTVNRCFVGHRVFDLIPKNVSLRQQFIMLAKRYKISSKTRSFYTLDYKIESVRQVKAGDNIASVAKILGVPHQTSFTWVELDREGCLTGAGSKVVSAEQMEIARLRAVNSRLKIERDILKKRPRTSPRNRCEVRMNRG